MPRGSWWTRRVSGVALWDTPVRRFPRRPEVDHAGGLAEPYAVSDSLRLRCDDRHAAGYLLQDASAAHSTDTHGHARSGRTLPGSDSSYSSWVPTRDTMSPLIRPF